MSRVWPSLFGALALAMPSSPMSANALSAAICGLPGATIEIPIGGAPMVPDHGCCKGACHSVCERKQPKREGAARR